MILQYLADGLCAGALFGIVGLSFAIIYRPSRFLNFAHGSTFIWAPYLAFGVTRILKWHVSVAICVAIVATSVIGAASYWAVYRPMRRRGATDLVLLLASLGLYIVFQNVVALCFGTDTKSLAGPHLEGLIAIGPVKLIQIQLTTFIAAIASFGTVNVFLLGTETGRRYRAVVADTELAVTDGIDPDRVNLWAFTIGSALAGAAGLLMAFDVGITPTMGLGALMMGIVALIAGGIEKVTGALFGGLLLGTVQGLASWRIGSQWQDAVAFGLLLIILVLRPRGLLNHRGRKV